MISVIHREFQYYLEAEHKIILRIC